MSVPFRLSNGRPFGLDPLIDALTIGQMAALAQRWLDNPASRPPEWQSPGSDDELKELVDLSAEWQAKLLKIADEL